MSTSDIIQLVTLIGSLVGLIGGAVWWCLQRYLNRLHHRIRALEDNEAQLEEAARDAGADRTRLEIENAHLKEQIGHLDKEAEKLQAKRQQTAEALGRLQVQLAEAKAKLDVTQKQVNQLTDRQTRHDAETAVVRGERDAIRSEREQLRQQLGTVQADLAVGQQQLKQVTEQEQRQRQRAEDLEQQLERSKEDALSHHEQVCRITEELRRERERLTQELERECDRADSAESSAAQLNEQITQVINQDERVWERAVADPAPPLLSLRRVPIIAVLNLKGGVGKTTITANLAGLMAEQGQKVLVIDADYQRNLSMLLVSDTVRRMLHDAKRTLQHFLKGPNPNRAALLATAHDVAGLPNCSVITNSDARLRVPGADESEEAGPNLEDISLEDVEMRLMAEWMFRRDGPDVRLLLRQALHDLRLQEKGYAYVLIDCPPRLSTACINALAASDFILVPVLLDATSARAVPNLLKTLLRLRRESIFPNLNLLGVVANGVKFRLDKPIAQQAETWEELPAVCRAGWGSDVHRFRAMIPHNQRFADYAGAVTDTDDGPRLALRDKEIRKIFSKLLQEMKTRIEHESNRLAAVPT